MSTALNVSNMKDIAELLKKTVEQTLIELEEKGNIVISTAVINEVSKPICENVMRSYAGSVLSPHEVMGLAGLISQATANEKFYDWEMPTLIGFTKEEMSELGRKLSATVNI